MKKYFFLTVLIFSNLVYGGELEIRKDIQLQVKNLFYKKNYAALNAMGNKFLKEESRTPSGLWKLTLFYGGLGSVIKEFSSSTPDMKELKSSVSEWITIDRTASFPHVFYTMLLINEAWAIRGNGWASEVKKENWKPFHEKIEEARLYLIQHEYLKHIDPQWYEKMLIIAKAQSWDHLKFYQFLNEALEKYPQFYELYFRAIDYFQPRWHGSVDEIEQFATAMTKMSEKYEGKGMYARIYWYASQIEFGFELFSKSDVRWNQMKLGIDDVLEKYPDQWNVNNFALFACLAKDAAKTKSLIEMIEGEHIKKVWKGDYLFEICKKLSFDSI